MSLRLAAALAVVLALASQHACAQSTPAQTGTDRELLNARSKGIATAPIRVIELSDFQCPWCRKFTLESSAALDSQYVATGKVRWLFVNLPIPQLHPNAMAAAELAMCAAQRGQFWPMHDLLFRNQPKWAPLADPEPFLLTFADSLRIPRDSILPCLRDSSMRQLVEQDAAVGARIGATSTPTFIIEGVRLPGAYPKEVFQHILDSIYTERTAPTRH